MPQQVNESENIFKKGPYFGFQLLDYYVRAHCTPPVVLSLGAGAEAERLVTSDQFYVWSLMDDYGSRTEITPIGRIDSSSAL